MTSIGKAAGGLLAIAALAFSAPGANGADFGIVPGSVAIETIDAEGNPDKRAGAHPDRLRIKFGFDISGTATKDLIFELSPGFGSNAHAVPKCTRTQFDSPDGALCPPETEVGLLSQRVNDFLVFENPVFNLEPPPGASAAFGVKPFWTTSFDAVIRPGDFGLTLKTNDLPQLAARGGSVELWGVPADHQQGTTIPRKPFLTTPTRCAPLTVTLRVRSWQVDAPWLSESATSDAPLEGCESLPFDPEVQVQLSEPAVDSPTGADIDLAMPASEDPDGRANAQIESMRISLPEGLGLSPGGAEGLQACSDEQFGLGTESKVTCPPASRMGAVQLETPMLREEVTGDLYLGEEHPGDRFRMFVAAPAPGLTIKLAGSLRADLNTGRLSADLTDLPQVPIDRLSMRLDGGPEALLTTPLACGQYVAAGRLEPYGGGAPANTSVPISIGTEPSCSKEIPFAPRLVAGSTSRRAGRSTTFSMTLLRKDGEQTPSRLSVTLPPGLVGAFGAVRRCSVGAVSPGSCPSGSRIGTAIAELGSGPDPAVIGGDVYLTDPYRHAPFGLAIVFRATIGPFDFGTIVTRAAVRLDRGDGRVTVATDPLPEIVDGVPIRFKTIGIDMDRPGLLRNPTSCAPTRIDATIQAKSGASAATQSPFSLGGCNALGFRPRFAMALSGRSELHRHGRPGLSISARTRRGDTNLRAMHLSLPGSLRFRTAGLREICSRRDAGDGLCSKRASIGAASARTPLLNRPLNGSIFVVQPKDGGLPDIWLSLEAMGVNVDIRGRAVREKGRFAVKMAGLPDVPLSALSMRFPRGEHGVFSLSRRLCQRGEKRRLLAPIALEGQNGAFRTERLRVAVPATCAGTPLTTGDGR